MKYTGDPEMAANVNPDEAQAEISAVPLKQEIMADFAKRLYRLRNARGWKPSELAARADILRDSVSSYENMKALPGAHNLEKLARALQVQPSDLLPNLTGARPTPRLRQRFAYRLGVSNSKAAYVEINGWITSATALKIATLMEDEPEVSNGD